MFRGARFVVALLLMPWTLAAAQPAHEHGSTSVTKAIAVLAPLKGSSVHGLVTFEAVENGVRVVADLSGLAPGKHGFHIHEFGDCSAEDGSSAGGHFNPAGMPHSMPTSDKRHAGDMGNIEAGGDGKAHIDYVDAVMSLSGDHAIVGRSVIVHEKEDDFKTQPTGNAGTRVACGGIGFAKGK